MSAAPLAGVRVVTIALNLPGPVAAARLQELRGPRWAGAP